MIVGEYLQRRAKVRPDKVALICNETRLTFNDLNIKADILANWAFARGIKKGDRAVVFLPNCAEFAVVYFAFMKIGVILVILDFRLGSQEMVPLFDETSPKILITHTKQKTFAEKMLQGKEYLQHTLLLGDEELEAKGENGLYSYDAALASGDGREPSIEISETDEALYLYTSGTTGKPKGVILTYDHLSCYPKSMKAMQACDEQDIQGAVLPMSHISGPIVLNLLVDIGHTIVIIDEARPKKILQEIQRNKINYFHGVPPIFQMLLNFPGRHGYDLSSLRSISMMGTVVAKEIMEKWVAEYPHCITRQGYGATETSPLLTLTHLDDARRKMASAGRPCPDVEIKIVDENDRELPTGEVGEVIAKGPQIMKGYFNNPEATAQKIRNGWYFTGDLGKFDEDGYIYILGRADDMIITGGLNVYPSELENILVTHEKIAEAAVVGIPDAERGQVLKAVVVPKDDEEVSEKELLRFCRERIANFKLPKVMEFRKSLPRSHTGKVVKQALKAQETNPN